MKLCIGSWNIVLYFLIIKSARLEAAHFQYAVSTNDVNCSSKNQVRCGNGRCYDRVQQCDSVDDCGDGTDESECEEVTKTLPLCLEKRRKECDSGECYDPAQRCDGVSDCGDRSDEKECDTDEEYHNETAPAGLCASLLLL